MTKKDYSDTIEFMRVALTRNDDSIRFSEGKAGFLFSFTGLIIGLFLNEITVFKPLLLSKGFLGTMAFVSLTLIINPSCYLKMKG